MDTAIPILCCFEQCNRVISNKRNSLCVGHYGQLRRGRELTPLLGRSGKKHDGACEFDLCYRQATVLRMCDAHYRQHRRGDTLSELKRKNPSGMGNVNKDGYRTISKPGHFASRKDGRIFEHIYVMTEFLGRRLYPEENVHHINGDKLDNRLENLELWSRSQPPGQRVSDKVAWAREILEKYGDPLG